MPDGAAVYGLGIRAIRGFGKGVLRFYTPFAEKSIDLFNYYKKNAYKPKFSRVEKTYQFPYGMHKFKLIGIFL
jgi:hypothetical protein